MTAWFDRVSAGVVRRKGVLSRNVGLLVNRGRVWWPLDAAAQAEA